MSDGARGTSRGRARIGVFVPYTNTNLEPDMALLCPDGVSAHFVRMGGYDEDAVPDGDQMRDLGAADLDEPLSLLAGARPDVVLYGCTSATLSHGPSFDAQLSSDIHQRMGVPTVTAAGALVEAFRVVGAKKIAFASPYVPTLNDDAIRFLSDRGIETVSRADWPEPLGNIGQGALTPDDAFDLACQADSAGADVVVLSCTDLRAVEAVARIEAHLGKPVITSNLAMMAQALTLIDINPCEIGIGQLPSYFKAASA